MTKTITIQKLFCKDNFDNNLVNRELDHFNENYEIGTLMAFYVLVIPETRELRLYGETLTVYNICINIVRASEQAIHRYFEI